MRAHIAFLASDLLEGREAGTRGYDIAADYAASQFRQMGLKPAGENGTWFQRTPLVAYRAADAGSLALTGLGGARAELVANEDFVVIRNPTREIRRSAPLVFVGYGVVAPERRRDDYVGLDVRGKIVVALEGAPRNFQTEERAYYRSARTKRLEAEKHGAVGFISVGTPASEDARPFTTEARNARAWAMTWRDATGRPYEVAPSVPQLALVSVKGAAKLFAGARTPLEKVYAAGDNPPRFELAVRAEAVTRAETRNSESHNVAGLIPGSDPTLAKETVVLSAHLDHVGLTEPVNGDGINNGALDNASGVATALEMARTFMESAERPKRSILVLLVTAEEKGLVGAEYFARNPTVPREDLVANVNLDMPLLTYDFTDVVAFGAERSGIGPVVRQAAGGMGIGLSPDPLPEEGLFTRSDHYRFVEAGVPSVFLMTGFQNGGEAKFRGFLSGCYHHPCDDTAQPIDYAAGAKFARLNYEIAKALANAPERPRWNRDDFFGRKFSQPAQRQP